MPKAPRLQALHTPWEADPTLPDWSSVHPRPQLQRDSFLPLCGEWSLSVVRGAASTHLGSVCVPFAPVSRLSGIERSLHPEERFVYQRAFTLPDGFARGRVLLHLGAVMQCCEILLNGHPIATHAGGYLPCTVELTEALLAGENTLTVIAHPIDTDIPYGKQRGKRGGMWYTPICGIWQTVWLESVPRQYISSLRLTPSLDRVVIESCGGERQKRLRVLLPDGEREYTYEGDRFELVIEQPLLWTPDTPHLYHFSIQSGEDTVRSYFALRTIATGMVNGKPTLLLNGAPYFFHGLLDQGYFSDGILTPASPAAYSNDILQMKALGFNMLRKHIKIEPEFFYYECDRLGMVVFQDMVNSGKYHFLLDTALPTLGCKRGISRSASPRRRAFFEDSMIATLRHLYNHPCVVYYTIFNKGWGQYDADRLYSVARAADPTRIWDTTSGWFFAKQSDVQSEHVYFKKLNLRPDGSARPLVLSEFGGYSLAVPEHVFNLDKAYGYRTLHTKAALTDALCRLYEDEVIPMIGRGLCACVLTQLSDVEDEINGLVTYDRRVLKVDAERMREIASKLQNAYKAQQG